MATERERKVQEKVIRLVRDYNGYVYKNAQNIYTEKGRPDLTACIPVSLKTLNKLFDSNTKVGLFLGIELKRDGHLNELSEAQQIVGNKIKNAAGLWIAVDDPLLVEVLLDKLVYDGV